MKTTVSLILALTVGLQLWAQGQLAPADYECQTFEVSYTLEGSKHETVLMFVPFYNSAESLRSTHLYLLTKNENNYLITDSNNSIPNLYQASISPDNTLLALLYIAEGHPWIELYNLLELLVNHQLTKVTELNPYPGSIDLVGWQGTKLVVAADIDLLQRTASATLTESNMLPQTRKFTFDPATQQCELFK